MAGSANSAAPTDAEPDANACRAQLRRIVESSAFDATDRDRRFLTYVVEEALAGRAARIKAYTIAVEVFGRDVAFDPQTDPIVRVEAGHLRRALDRYYLGAGSADPVVISIPKGGYVPRFSERDKPAVTVEPARAGWRPRSPTRPFILFGALVLMLVFLAGGYLLRREPPRLTVPEVPRVTVMTLRLLNGDPSDAAFATGLASELVGELARFRDIVVATPLEGDGAAISRTPGYSLEGNVARDGEELKARLTLRRNADETVVWARSYATDLSAERPLAAESRIAAEAATAIGQPYGAIFQAAAAARSGKPIDPEDGYACVIAYFEFRATIDEAGYRSVRDCVERVVARFPDYATGWGLRSQVAIDGRRWGFDPGADINGALADARRALMLDATNVRATQAKMMGLYFGGDFAGALRVGAAGIALNPNDTDILGEYGYRLALSGDWTEGCGLLASAVERNPGPLPYYETGLALCDYIAGEYESAAARVRTAPFPEVPIYHLIAAALFAEAGQSDEARREGDWLRAHAPSLIENLPTKVRPLVGRAEDYDRFMRSLARAGVVG